ncbi:hypothetical protein UY3_06768, partial [Chelonia mydas]
GQQAPAPKSKDSKHLDLFGRKESSTGGLQVRIANQLEASIPGTLLKFKELVPAESREEFGAIVEEGRAVTRTSLQASLDAAGSATHNLSSGIAKQHSSSLQASELLPEVQQTMQDLPFDGAGLFAEQMDCRPHSLKDSQVTEIVGHAHPNIPMQQPQRSYPPGLLQEKGQE